MKKKQIKIKRRHTNLRGSVNVTWTLQEFFISK